MWFSYSKNIKDAKKQYTAFYAAGTQTGEGSGAGYEYEAEGVHTDRHEKEWEVAPVFVQGKRTEGKGDL